MLDIVMPFYGRLDYLQASVRSVLGQTSDGWRLVIVDDQYPDPEPGEWVQSLADPRVVYHRNAENLGVTGNFNRCIEVAEADHVMLIGFDDLLRPGLVERALELIAAHPDAEMIAPGVGVIDGEGRAIVPMADRIKARLRPAPGVHQGEALATTLMHGNWAYFPAMIWRTDVMRAHRFRAEHWVVQDLALMVDLILDGARMVVDDVVVFDYRRHLASVSGSGAGSGAIFDDEQALFSSAAERFAARGWTQAARAARWHLTSRLHALAEVPGALRSRDMAGVRALLAHTWGRTRPSAGRG